MTQIVFNSAVKQQIAMTLLMAPSQPSHFLEKQPKPNMSSPTPNAPIQHPANRRPPLCSAMWDHVSSVTITKSTTCVPN
ncbi:hypothetical protein E2C01_084874 [Portunus trituberculatus]|uniref:Uncharacterized protein n=1 Tax=Portunus trituberculatus TaxID=210409 RepID=A0A5B7IWH3_PORTR|nr:hypothetical protein [Portunus trituberculatus]